MELKKLDKSVLKLWYIRAAVFSLALVGAWTSVAVVLLVSEASGEVILGVLLTLGLALAIPLGISLVMPALRYKRYAWGYDDKRIIVKQGVIFKSRVVIPVCQIQDLHRSQGPIMMLLKLSDVTISTAGSNFNISTLTTLEADRMIDELESNLEARIEELKDEEI